MIPLIAALISAAVALVVFLGGQWVQSRARRTDFLRTKLETYYRSLQTVVECCALPSHNGQVPSAEWNDLLRSQARKLTYSLVEPHMMAHLYFSRSLPKFQPFANQAAIIHQWMHDTAESNKTPDFAEFSLRFQAFNSALMDLKNFLRDSQDLLIRGIAAELRDRLF